MCTNKENKSSIKMFLISWKIIKQLLVFSGLLSVLFFQSCMNGDKIEYSGELTCDLETISKNKKKICTSNPKVEFSYIKTRTKEESRSGDYSIKLSKKRLEKIH